MMTIYLPILRGIMWMRNVIRVLANLITQPINILLLPIALVIFLLARASRLAQQIEVVIVSAERGIRKKKRGK
jgi:hypothetical protein